MTKLYDKEALAERARNLGALNGFRLAVVTLDPLSAPTHAWLDVQFHNSNELDNIVDDLQPIGVAPTSIFSIAGGSRIRAGNEPGQVQVTQVSIGSDADVLRLRVEPVGDYSTYTLSLTYQNIDPVFSRIDFKFRPGCFNLNCAPDRGKHAPAAEPVIDYLAKDFDSFKHVLINAMRERVPDWTPTSEADLDQVLIDLIAADADELSDYQDRVMNEAYLGHSRKRVSLARHARLMDYHIHQGNQASTWLALNVGADLSIPAGFGAWTGEDWRRPGSLIFVSALGQECFIALNRLDLYTWGGVVTALEAGTTEADLIPESGPMTAVQANELRELLRRVDITHLVIEQKLNPETGTEQGRDKTARQVLRLMEGDDAARSVQDPLVPGGAWMVRVRWREEDALQRRYCFVTDCEGEDPLEGISAFHANLVKVAHGRPHVTVFRPPDAPLGTGDSEQFVRWAEAHHEHTPWGRICRLPGGPLAYRATAPGGEASALSTLDRQLEVSGFSETWAEQGDLIESQGDACHFIVETDEGGLSTIRFGNNVNGRAPEQDATVTCRYQAGLGSAGNIGADSLTGFDGSPGGFPDVLAVWNPLDVTDGRDPEPREEIIRRVPQAYRTRQLRAVTLQDYADRAEELPGVSHARAAYAWTGSWRTVRVAIDPSGRTEFSDELRTRVAHYLDAVRLIGEDLEVRGARYVGLDILLRVCAHPDYWPQALAHELEGEFSDGYTPDGRPAFFHPDLWTFGQPLHASQIVGRALSVEGVERVLLLSMRRWNAGTGPSTLTISITPEELPLAEIDTLEVKPFEVIQVANDPSQLEKGRMRIEFEGGRQ